MSTRGSPPPCGYIDSTLRSETNITLDELKRRDERHREDHSTPDAWELIDTNTGTLMSLPKTMEERDGTYVGEPPRLMMDMMDSDSRPEAFPVPEGQTVYAAVDLSLTRGGEPYTPDSLAGVTLSFSLLRLIVERDGMLVWWQNADGQWISKECPPNRENVIRFQTVESLGLYIITVNKTGAR